MIRIRNDGNIILISAAVTDFTDSMGYCEYKIPLSIEGVRPKPSQSLLMGSAAHDAEEKYEKEHVEFEPVTKQELKDEKKNIEFAREDIHTTLIIPFNFSKEKVLVSLSGRTDKIMRVDGTLVVQDDKFVARPETYDNKKQPYPGQLLQVLAYLNSNYSSSKPKTPEDFFEMPHTEKRWQIRICDRKTREPYKTFSEVQDSFALQYLHTSLEKFASIAIENAEPSHHNSKAKCNACNLKSLCEFRI
ncbi:MAG: PD-(D/E)XK nuclease family protein [Candidatus Nitrosopelagicus sp.]|nr:PD-(D/E)XK nuclease family protein [Candidatus Nitrosopelagicus sp.]